MLKDQLDEATHPFVMRPPPAMGDDQHNKSGWSLQQAGVVGVAGDICSQCCSCTVQRGRASNPLVPTHVAAVSAARTAPPAPFPPGPRAAILVLVVVLADLAFVGLFSISLQAKIQGTECTGETLRRKGPRVIVVMVVVGGASYSELQAVYHLSRLSRRQVLYCSVDSVFANCFTDQRVRDTPNHLLAACWRHMPQHLLA